MSEVLPPAVEDARKKVDLIIKSIIDLIETGQLQNKSLEPHIKSFIESMEILKGNNIEPNENVDKLREALEDADLKDTNTDFSKLTEYLNQSVAEEGK